MGVVLACVFLSSGCAARPGGAPASTTAVVSAVPAVRPQETPSTRTSANSSATATRKSATARPTTGHASPRDVCSPATTTLSLPDGAVGGSVLAVYGDVAAGAADRSDGTSDPVLWRAGSAGTWDVTNLGHRSDLPYGAAIGVAADGSVAYTYGNATSTDGVGYRRSADGQIQTLTDPGGGTDVLPYAMSTTGVVIGNAGGTPGQPLLWGAGFATAHSLTVAGPDQYVIPSSINDHGDVVGVSDLTIASTPVTGLVWPNGRQPLTGPSFDTVVFPESISNEGTLVGWHSANGANDEPVGFVQYPGSGETDLPPAGSDTSSVAWSVSAGGLVVGASSQGSSATSRAVYWAADGTVRVLPGADATTASGAGAAFGVDDSGRAWGQSTSAGGRPQPTLWTCLDRFPPATAERVRAPSRAGAAGPRTAAVCHFIRMRLAHPGARCGGRR